MILSIKTVQAKFISVFTADFCVSIVNMHVNCEDAGPMAVKRADALLTARQN